MDQVMEVAVHIDLGEDADGKHHPGQFLGHALLQEVLVGGVGRVVKILHLLGEGGVVEGGGHLAALFVLGVGGPPLGGYVKLIGQLGVATAPFVEAKGPMPDELPHDKDGHFDVVGDGALLKGARVPVLVKVEEQFLVLILTLAGALVGDAGGLDDAQVGAEVVDVPDVPLAENGNGVAFIHEGRIEPRRAVRAERKRSRVRLSCEKFELLT